MGAEPWAWEEGCVPDMGQEPWRSGKGGLTVPRQSLLVRDSCKPASGTELPRHASASLQLGGKVLSWTLCHVSPCDPDCPHFTRERPKLLHRLLQGSLVSRETLTPAWGQECGE